MGVALGIRADHNDCGIDVSTYLSVSIIAFNACMYSLVNAMKKYQKLIKSSDIYELCLLSVLCNHGNSNKHTNYKHDI